MAEADDIEVRRLSLALRERQLTRCIDLRMQVDADLPQKKDEGRDQRQARIKLVCDGISDELERLESENIGGPSRILVDQYVRHPYKRFQDSKSPLNQILIRIGDGPPRDMADMSPTIAHAEPFNLCRAYVFRGDSEAESMIRNIMRTKIREGENVQS